MRAKVSKATLYRRWPSKFALIQDAVLRAEELIEPSEVDTGHLRSDLIETFHQAGGGATTKDYATARWLPSIPERRRHDLPQSWVGNWAAAEVDVAREIFARAQARGEIQPDRDLNLAASVLPGVLMHYECASGSDRRPRCGRTDGRHLGDALTGSPLARQERG